MKRFLILILALLTGSAIAVADTLTLWKCIRDAETYYPLVKDKENFIAAGELKLRNLNASWLPRVDFNGQATWQSDVIEFNLQLPYGKVNMPNVPHENIKATIDINQTFYDGGTTRTAKKVEQEAIKTDLQQLSIDMEKIKEQVMRAYFALLILQENERLVQSLIEDLNRKMTTVEQGIKNGILVPADKDVLTVEILKAGQRLFEIKNDKQQYVELIQQLTNQQIKPATSFQVPVIPYDDQTAIARPEYELFSLQTGKLHQTIKLKSTQRMPRLYGFAQFGYGKPGLNYMNDSYDSFVIVGAGLKWNLWDWNTVNREKQLITIQQRMIETRREVFDKQLNTQLINARSAISRYSESVATYQKIVVLRESITRSCSARFENGTMTSTDYLSEVNAETQQRINLETYKLLLLQAQADYMQLKGQLKPLQ